MKITANGNYKVKTQTSKSVVRAYGTFGGGSLTLGFKDSVDGTVRAYADNNTAKTAAGEWIIEQGRGTDIYVICSGATSPDINIDYQAV